MIDVGEMVVRARTFAKTLDDARAKAPPQIKFYPYPMLPAMAEILDSMLTGANRRLLDLAGDRPIADIGGADGDFSFFLESLGCDVDLIDHGATRPGASRTAAQELKHQLDSKIGIYDIDVDHAFELPRRYDLVFLMGILYHLRNPFIVLETLAESARYCVVSTKIARYTGVKRLGRKLGAEVADVPMAYLLDTRECNNDPTNFWVFTEAGLRRIAGRAGWSVLDYTSVGNRESATPATMKEERAWCLLKNERLQA